VILISGEEEKTVVIAAPATSCCLFRSISTPIPLSAQIYFTYISQEWN
jgi:hypothetical protein